MNTNPQNPMFYILEAAPERYIKTPSAAIVMLIRVVEGIAACAVFFKVLGYLLGLFGGASEGFLTLLVQRQAGQPSGILPPMLESMLQDQLSDLLPPGATISSLVRETYGSSIESLQVLLTPGMTETVITGIGATALLVILAGTVIEAVALIFLRFALKGARPAVIAHRGIFTGTVVLLLASLCMAGIFAGKCRSLGISGALLTGQFRTMVIAMAACMILLLLSALYHRDVVKVLAAVDYEIRMGFKKTGLQVKRLPGMALLFTVLALLGAAILALRTGSMSAGVFALVILMIKYAMVYTCWGNFRRRHM